MSECTKSIAVTRIVPGSVRAPAMEPPTPPFTKEKHMSLVSGMTLVVQEGSMDAKSIDFVQNLPDTVMADSTMDSTMVSRSSDDIESKGDLGLIQEWKPQKAEWVIMFSLATIALMVALDATILCTVLPSIATALHGTSTDAFWAGTSYLLSSAVFQPVVASISQLFGRRYLLLTSLLFFTVGTIVCCVANNFTVLLVGRSIQGIGGGGIITLSQVIFCDIVPLRQRPQYFSIVLGSWSIGSIIGPVIGGALVQHLSWRWIFYINLPLCFVSFILVGFFFKLSAVDELSFTERLRRVDWLGTFLFVSGMTVFLIGLSWGGIQYPWDSAATLAPLIIGLTTVAVFVLWQKKASPHSLMPLSLFYCPSSFAAFYCAMINGLLLFTATYYVPFYFMSVKAASPSRAGVDIFPALFLLIPGSIVVSLITSRIGRFRWAIWTGFAVTTLGSGLYILFDLQRTYAVEAVFLAIFGIGSGMVLTSVNFGVQAIAKTEDSAMAASMYGFFRSLGMPLGVAISGTIFQNAMSDKLESLGLPVKIAHESEAFVAVLGTLSDDDPTKVGALQAYVHGFRSVWIMMTVFAATGLVASVVIKKFSMDRLLKSNFTAR